MHHHLDDVLTNKNMFDEFHLNLNDAWIEPRHGADDTEGFLSRGSPNIGLKKMMLLDMAIVLYHI